MGTKKTILAIDDFVLNLRIVQEVFSEQATIYTAKSGNLALQTLSRVEVDLFLVDIEMPGMSGIEFLKTIRGNEKYKKTPVIIVSAKNSADILMEVAAYGISDYIVKPFKKEVLYEKVTKVLGIA